VRTYLEIHRHVLFWTIIQNPVTYRTVKKLLVVKKLAKRLLQRIGKKTLANVDLHANRQLSINSKTKPNESIPNIDEHNKTNSAFFRICLRHVLVVCCSMMARCTVKSMIHGYHKYNKQTITWKWTGPLKYCNIDILTLIQTRNKLKPSSHCCTRLILQK